MRIYREHTRPPLSMAVSKVSATKMRERKNSIEVLGEVTVPSGIVLLIDFGLMDLWTHDKPPLINPGILNSESMESANNGKDFQINGQDAVAAGKQFKRQPHPLYLYDIPLHETAGTIEQFDSMTKSLNLSARLSELPTRVPPRERVNQTLAHESGAGEIFLHGIHCIAVSEIPADLPLRLEAEPGQGEFAGRWRQVTLVIDESKAICRSRKIGHVAIDMSRLMFCDVEIAGDWKHQESTDGMADLVLRGKDANRLARKFGAAHLSKNLYGFANIPIVETQELYSIIRKTLTKHRLAAALDIHPHSDHWRMLKSISESENEAAVIELNQQKCCGFMTGSARGFFPVYLDHSADGRPVSIRIDLSAKGNPC